MAYDPSRNAWGETWGETWDGSWCWDLPAFGIWFPITPAICLWKIFSQWRYLNTTAIAQRAIASLAIANTVGVEENTIPENLWTSVSVPCTWEKIRVE